MDEDLIKQFNRYCRIAEGEAPGDEEKGWEWSGTGLCERAQADGVPCYVVGRSCDLCGEADDEDRLVAISGVTAAPKRSRL